MDDLVPLLKAGDPDAFRHLVDSRQDKVYSICFHHLKAEDDAADAAQEVFLKIYRSIDGFREDANLDTWIYRIAVTVSLDHLRRRKRKQPWLRGFLPGAGSGLGSPLRGSDRDRDLDPQLDPGLLSTEEGDPWRVVERKDDPHSQLERKEDDRRLYDAIDGLPINQRTAILLHYMEGLHYDEIADVMQVSFPAVESLLFRARKNLQKKLSNSTWGV
jgi:RNA polymerase sigma factor (sigma-70 family)